MSEALGIKETKEAVQGLLAVSSFLAVRLKDGAGVDDAAALVQKLMMDDEFKKVLEAAVEGAKQIPAEVKDLSLAESLELALVGVGGVKDIVTGLRG